MPALRLSRYEYAPVEVDESNRTFLDIPQPVSKSTLLRGASAVVVREGDTVWSIAWRAYRNLIDREQDLRPTSFFDAIAEANDIVDVVAPLTPGVTLFVPSIEVLFSEFRVPPPFNRANTVT